MARTIYGTITDSTTGQPVQGTRVRAYDSDWGADDFMGESITDANGEYSIEYAGGHWDPAAPGSTKWRPDIYITIYSQTEAGWVKVFQSTTHSNHRNRNDLRIDAAIHTVNPLARTVYGRVTREVDGSPLSYGWIEAWDRDLGPDDYMGGAETDAEGNYKITYQGHKWDAAVSSGAWRPDISVEVWTGNRTEDHMLFRSRTHRNHRMGGPLHLDVVIPDPEQGPDTGDNSGAGGAPADGVGAGSQVLLFNDSGEIRFVYRDGINVDTVFPEEWHSELVPCGVPANIQVKDDVTDAYNAVTLNIDMVGACEADLVVYVSPIY